jgi:hypothetical protein
MKTILIYIQKIKSYMIEARKAKAEAYVNNIKGS